MSFPVRQRWLFVSSCVFQWQYVWLVSCCWNLWPVKSGKNGRVFVSAAVAAVHFSPELLSEKPVTLLMINASVRWAVSELQQPLNLDSRSVQLQTHNLRPPTSACPSVQQISGHLSSVWPAAASVTGAYAKRSLNVESNAHAATGLTTTYSQHGARRERVTVCYWEGIGITQIIVCMRTTWHLNAT